MTERARQLKRIAALRGMQERRREVELFRESLTLKMAGDRVEAALKIAGAASLTMVAGEGTERMMEARICSLAAASVPGLRRMVGECGVRVDESQRLWSSCKRQTEQALLLGRAVHEQELREMERRSQAESDDRFASRKDWMARRGANLKLG